MKKWVQGNEYKAIIVIALVLIALLVLTYFLSSGSPGDFFRNSIISLTVEIVSILATVFLLTRLLNMRQDRISKERAREITKHNYDIFVYHFFSEFHLFITKKQYQSADNSVIDLKLLAKETLSLKDDIENIITEDFYMKNPKGTVFENKSANVFDNFNTKEIDIHLMSMNFRSENKKRIDDFLMKYSVILPDDLRNSLYQLDNILLTSYMLRSPYELGIAPLPENIRFDPKNHQEQSVEILDTLYQLLTYYDETKINK